MIQAKCIQKFRDKNNHIYSYRLQDLNGQTQDVQSKNLKQAIASGQIHVVNLTLTKDNRLVDTNEKQLQSKQLGPKPKEIQEVDEAEKLVYGVAKLIFRELGYTGEIREIESLNNNSQDAIDERFEIAGKQLYYDNEIAQVAVTYYFESKELWVDIDNAEAMSLCEMKCKQPINKQNIGGLVKSFVKEIKSHIGL